MRNYIKFIREKIGHQNIFLNFSAAVILNNSNEVLLQQRGDSKQWGLPGGAMELGESAEKTIIREVLEETGLSVKPYEFLGIYTHPKYKTSYPNGDKCQPILFVFYCKIKQGSFKIDGKETLNLKFFSFDNLPKIFSRQHIDVLKDAVDNKKNVYK